MEERGGCIRCEDGSINGEEVVRNDLEVRGVMNGFI